MPPASPPEPPSDNASSNRPSVWEWALLLQALVLACAIRLQWVGFDLDDSFITYTYSRSLAEGHGFVFAGQKALGTTTPLYALLLAGLSYLGLPIVESAKALGLAGALIGCVLLFALGRATLGPWAGLAGAALLAMNARHAATSMSGMETALYGAVCLGAFYAFHCKRPVGTAALCATACLLRPDGVLVPLVLAVAHVADRRKLQLWPLLAFVLPVGAWIAYATVEFGSAVPASLVAKLAYPEYGPFKLETAAKVFGPELMWPLVGLTSVGVVYAAVKIRPLLPLVLWTALYLGAFTRAPNFPWYYVPPIPGLILASVAGLVALFRVAFGRPGWGWTAVSGFLGMAIAAGVIWIGLEDGREHRAFMNRTYGPGVTGAYHSLALWIRDNTLEDAVIGVPEVGYVGFYSQRRILDLAGLCSPEVIPFLPDRRYVEIVQHFRPDYVALTTEPNRPIHNVISESDWFRRNYTACKKFPYRGGKLYLVYRRLMHPLPKPAAWHPPLRWTGGPPTKAPAPTTASP